MSERFRKKAVEVEAVQWTGENRGEVEALAGCSMARLPIGLLGDDWLIRHADGTLVGSTPGGFEANYEPADQPTQPVLDLEVEEVQIALDPECIEAENVREFYPEAVGAAMGALREMLDPDDDARAHRDADILACCVCSEAFKALVTVALLSDSKEKGTEG